MGSEAVKTSFNLMRMIVTIGWAIYPAGYYFGVLKGKADDQTLNVIYNLADFVNKIMFVCACWSCAKSELAASKASKVGASATRSCLCVHAGLVPSLSWQLPRPPRLGLEQQQSEFLKLFCHCAFGNNLVRSHGSKK